MEEKKEGLELQQIPAGGGEPKNLEEVTLSKTELEELKHRAEVSSQNFERAKKAEEETRNLRQRLQEYEVPPGEGGEELGQIKSEIAELKQRAAKSEILESYPQLKAMWSELEEFQALPENQGMNLRTAAKAFMVEKELLEPRRPGLEKPTGGPRVLVSTKMTPEEVKALREEDPRRYREMLMAGKLDF